MEGGRDIFQGTVVTFAWKDLRKPCNTPFRRTAGTSVEIQTESLIGTSHQCYHHTKLVCQSGQAVSGQIF
jgi:hypothetical protein